MKYTMNSNNKDFWQDRINLVCSKMLPLQLSILKDQAPDTEPSHAIENFEIAAGIKDGKYYGMVFQDSDLGKWIEGVSYKLMIEKDDELEAEIDRLVEIIGKAQQPDGYLNTYYTVKEPGNRWTNLEECHELYCAGHLMEAAVAYYDATGKREFLDIMCRMADHIDTVLGPEEGKLHGYPGHPEVELGLFRLYGATKNEKYLKLAKFFIDERGKEPNFFEEEFERRGRVADRYIGIHGIDKEYMQAHKPIREQDEAVGHSVRALYLYASMAEVAAQTGDETLIAACERMWDSAVNRKMYITGNFGATHVGEAFMGDYELPNDTAYAETCASIAAVFFGKAMLKLRGRDGEISDVIEKIIYNGMLSGMNLTADRFYYVNPLEVVQGLSGKQPGHKHVRPTRPKWFACACCPPNMARLIPSLPLYAYSEEADGITIHQYLGGIAEFDKLSVELDSNYPWDGDLKWSISAKENVNVYVRVPGWCGNAVLSLNGEVINSPVEKGYVCAEVPAGENELFLQLEMKPQRWYAHHNVRNDAGMVAFSYGPVVYCFEGVDNPEPLSALRVGKGEVTMSEYNAELLGGVKTLTVEGVRYTRNSTKLYDTAPLTAEAVTLKGIPYYAWANREQKDMRVWLLEE